MQTSARKFSRIHSLAHENESITFSSYHTTLKFTIHIFLYFIQNFQSKKLENYQLKFPPKLGTKIINQGKHKNHQPNFLPMQLTTKHYYLRILVTSHLIAYEYYSFNLADLQKTGDHRNVLISVISRLIAYEYYSLNLADPTNYAF